MINFMNEKYNFKKKVKKKCKNHIYICNFIHECKKLELRICYDISIIDLYFILKNCLYIKIYYNDTIMFYHIESFQRHFVLNVTDHS